MSRTKGQQESNPTIPSPLPQESDKGAVKATISEIGKKFPKFTRKTATLIVILLILVAGTIAYFYFTKSDKHVGDTTIQVNDKGHNISNNKGTINIGVTPTNPTSKESVPKKKFVLKDYESSLQDLKDTLNSDKVNVTNISIQVQKQDHDGVYPIAQARAYIEYHLSSNATEERFAVYTFKIQENPKSGLTISPIERVPLDSPSVDRRAIELRDAVIAEFEKALIAKLMSLNKP